ncbi:hypothetical protein AAC387_Pa05g2816 [Persea americana]
MPLLHPPPHGEGSISNLQDENTGRPFIPYISGENAFLFSVITPIYDAIKAEVALPLTPPSGITTKPTSISGDAIASAASSGPWSSAPISSSSEKWASLRSARSGTSSAASTTSGSCSSSSSKPPSSPPGMEPPTHARLPRHPGTCSHHFYHLGRPPGPPVCPRRRHPVQPRLQGDSVARREDAPQDHCRHGVVGSPLRPLQRHLV